MDGRLYLTLLLSALILADVTRSTDALCNSEPTAIPTGAEFWPVEVNLMGVLICTDGNLFSTSDVAITIYCVDGAWMPTAATCDSASRFEPCTVGTETVKPTGSKETVIKDGKSDGKAVQFRCEGTDKWLSGEPAKVSQCRDGKWSAVLDVCDEACSIPRDCYDVEQLGFTASGDYMIVPSGVATDTTVHVHCDLSEDPKSYGGHWTTVLINNGSLPDLYLPTKSLYDRGVPYTSDKEPMFLGLENLYQLTMMNDTARPLVMQVQLQIEIDDPAGTATYHTTYSNFSMGSSTTTYAIQSLGSNHGDAGDGLCPHTHSAFAVDADGAGWWGEVDTRPALIEDEFGSMLTGNPIRWAALEGKGAISLATIRVRPAHYDETVQCPANIGIEPYWTTTTGEISPDRSPGSIVNYTCQGDFMKELSTDTVTGSVICKTDFTWNTTLTLPCALKCPEGYEKNFANTKCLFFATDTAVGIHQASQKCIEKGASLVALVNGQDLQAAVEGTDYYTAHTFSESESFPKLDMEEASFSCPTTPENCTLTAENPCAVVSKDGNVSVVPCDQEFSYICQLPVYCPAGYTEAADGACYMVSLVPDGTLEAGMDACKAKGASIAYPVTKLQFDNMIQALQIGPTTIERGDELFIGPNDMIGDWTANGTYPEPDNDLATTLKTTEGVKHYRAISFVVDGATAPTVTMKSWEDTATKGTVCQWHTVADCQHTPPEQKAYMTSENKTTKAFKDPNVYTCDGGAFVSGNITLPAKQTLTCRGPLGMWQPALLPCQRVEVCTEGNPPDISSLQRNATDSESSYLGGNITYECPEGMGVNGSTVNQTAICTFTEPATYSFLPELKDCSVCLGAPDWNNATATSPEDEYVVGKEITITCNASYQVEGMDDKVQTVPCSASGWNVTLKPCKLVCLGDPTEPISDMAKAAVTERWVGSEVLYTCTDGMNLESTETLPVQNTTKATCNATGHWETERDPANLTCYKLCLDDPTVPPTGANYTWTTDGSHSRRVDTQVNYTAAAGSLWGNRTDTLISTCNIEGKWTSVSDPNDPELFTTSKACLADPPTAMGGATQTWHGMPAWVSEELNYTCADGQVTTLGQNQTTISCSASGEWIPVEQTLNMTTLNDTFLCKAACPGPPVEAPEHANSSYTTDYTDGAVVNYTCPLKFTDGNQTITNNCTGGNWTVFELPICLTTTTMGPTTEPPIVLPMPDKKYPETADFHIGTMQNNFTDTDGKNATYTATDAPFSFGYAVQLQSEMKQCLKKDFNMTVTPCMAYPGNCSDGLSFSIWAKHVYSEALFKRWAAPLDTDTKYILSSGGDDKGHPGIALYQEGINQVALVSVGTEYWRVKVPGQLTNATWNNLGVRWNPNVTFGPDKVTPIAGGLEFFVNLKVVGQSRLIERVAEAKAPLEPPELMLGCHKTSTDKDYRNFGDGEYDELANWNRPLADGNLSYFLGGYLKNFSNITPEKMASMLEKVDLGNPAQFAAGINILGQMTNKEELPDSAPDPETTTSTAVMPDTSPTPTGPNSVGSLSDDQSVQQRETYLDIMNNFLNSSLLPENYTLDVAETYMQVLASASDLLELDSASEWKKIQENGSAGASALVTNLETFMSDAFCGVQYIYNVTDPMIYVKTTKNIIFYAMKMPLEDLKEKGQYVVLPNYQNPELKKKKEEWNLIFDAIRVPTGIMNDVRCNKRPTCVTAMVFDTYSSIGPNTFSYVDMSPESEQLMGSRVMSFKIKVDKGRLPNGDIDTNAPICRPDFVEVASNPYYIKLEHNVKIESIRNLLFHSQEVVTKVVTRRCARWNTKLSDFGAFDTTGCRVIESTAYATRCSCLNFGLITILDEQLAPAEVADEAFWVTMVKYILYGISAVLLILYCAVVGLSGDLKEQFHLMGMYLSLCVLFGSAFMCLSDLDAIRDSRHMCTTISTLIHFFYIAAGAWVACLGHACFKAITSGDVSGKLHAYSCISWGLALVSVGVPYAFFIRDLGTDPRCFISWANIGKATFFLPQMVYVCNAFFFGFVVLCNMSTPALRKENLIDDVGSFCRGASFVMLYFAFTWVFGLLAYMRFDLDEDFYPMFQIMNSMMGIIIFLFIGLGSKRYRTVLAGQAKARREQMMKMAGQEGQKGKKLKNEDVPSMTPEDQVESSPVVGSSLSPPSRGQVAGRPGSRPVTPH